MNLLKIAEGFRFPSDSPRGESTGEPLELDLVLTSSWFDGTAVGKDALNVVLSAYNCMEGPL